MRYREGGSLDTSAVQDRRGRGGLGGGRGLAVGGGGLGVVGVAVFLLIQLLGGGGGDVGAALGGLSQLNQGEQADNTQLEQACNDSGDANSSVDCAVVADIESIQDFWAGQLGDRYQRTNTVYFSGQVQTQCGGATSGSGPFYCPADQLVYIDLSFFDDLQQRFGAEGGLFVNAYVIAHEYGHHVQNLLGTNSQVTPGETGPTSGTVRLELQADCYAGVWAYNARQTGFIKPLVKADIDDGLDAASAVGDDRIQEAAQGRVDPESWTHGSSEQRQRWFTTGYKSGSPGACDTFAPGVDL